MAFNRHLSHNIRILNCDQGSDYTKQMCRLAKAIAVRMNDTQNSEYDREISQSQTADKPMALRGIATQQSRDTRKTN